MAEFLIDLENMAANVEAAVNHRDVRLQDIKRWQALFEYSHAKAKREIEKWRAMIDRLHVPDDLWEMVRKEKENEGFDHEAYEYAMWLTTMGKTRSMPNETSPPSANASYVLKLEEPLESAEKVQDIAHLAHPPKIATGVGESSDARFCTLDSFAYLKISSWIAAWHPTFRPTIVRLSGSLKALDNNSMAPALGFDSTLPHHRANDDDEDFKPKPAQDQYPVWYFFYGNLAKPEELQRRLGLPEPPTYIPALIRGGRIRSWRGKYRALTDTVADASEHVNGSAYLVASKEHEDILRYYETEKYEVVRCDIEVEDRTQKGLVFRFAGKEHELE